MHFAHMHQIWLFLYLENTFSTFLSYADLVVEWKLSILEREIKDRHWQLNNILIRFEDLDLIIELSRNFIMASGQKSLSSSLLRRPDTRWNWSFERFLEGWKTENISWYYLSPFLLPYFLLKKQYHIIWTITFLNKSIYAFWSKGRFHEKK